MNRRPSSEVGGFRSGGAVVDDPWYDEPAEEEPDDSPYEEALYDPELYEALYCPYTGRGSFSPGDEFCVFLCALREACRASTEEGEPDDRDENYAV
jgi:hypothetical protein